MSTTKAFEIPKSVKAARIKNRFVPKDSPPKGAPSPAVKDNLVERIATDKKHSISDGITTTIDVQPDFRWILMCLMYYANIYYSAIDIKNRAKTSPLTVTAYFLVIVNAHLLVSDLYLRNTPSFWANQFMNDASRRDYLEFILSLPVPDILMKFIETLSESRDPRRPHLQYVCTAAAFSLYHDFGRFFTPASFLQAHTLAATIVARGDTESVLAKFFDLTCFSTYKNGQLFGQHMSSQTHSLDYDSKLFQAFTALYNPVVERSLQRRNCFASTPVTPYEATHDEFNPYICMLHATDFDISEMQTVLESVSVAVNDILSFKGQLGSLYDNLSGLDILRHGYSSYALPTWHTGTILRPSAQKPIKLQNSKDRAKSIDFLQTATAPNGVELSYPDDASVINKVLYLVKKVTKNDNSPDPDTDFRDFHPRYDVNPRVRILDPYDVNPSTFSSVVYTGLIIESLEIDGSIVLHPDVDSTLDECNSQVLQSAIPLQAIRRATVIGSPDDNTATTAIDRVKHFHAHQKASISFVDAGTNVLGLFDLTVSDAVPTELPAFTVREHTSWFSRMYNVIAYKTASREILADESSTRVENGRVILWSPYRYIAATWTPKKQASNCYMLANLRTNYGMNVPLSEIAHPSDLIPIN